MKRKIAVILTSMALFFGLFTPITFAAPCTLYTAPNFPQPEVLVPWYKYLPGDDSSGKCRVDLPKKAPGSDEISIAKSVTLIAIAIIELLTHLAGLIAIGYIIYGAFQYITSQGEPEGLSNAKNTITNALIGFVIIVLAIAIVQFVGRAFS